MSLKSEDVHASLRRHVNWLRPSVHEEIVGGLRKDGLVEDHSGTIRAAADRTQRAPVAMTVRAARAAATPDQARLIRNAVSTAAHMGHRIDEDKQIDIDALNRDIRHCDTQQRIFLKSSLQKLGLLAL